jgi:hypothetical protein
VDHRNLENRELPGEPGDRIVIDDNAVIAGDVGLVEGPGISVISSGRPAETPRVVHDPHVIP